MNATRTSPPSFAVDDWSPGYYAFTTEDAGGYAFDFGDAFFQTSVEVFDEAGIRQRGYGDELYGLDAATRYVAVVTASLPTEYDLVVHRSLSRGSVAEPVQLVLSSGGCTLRSSRRFLSTAGAATSWLSSPRTARPPTR